jgi:hypothetical protein
MYEYSITKELLISRLKREDLFKYCDLICKIKSIFGQHIKSSRL